MVIIILGEVYVWIVAADSTVRNLLTFLYPCFPLGHPVHHIAEVTLFLRWVGLKFFTHFTLTFFMFGANNFIMSNIAYLWLKEIFSKM